MGNAQTCTCMYLSIPALLLLLPLCTFKWPYLRPQTLQLLGEYLRASWQCWRNCLGPRSLRCTGPIWWLYMLWNNNKWGTSLSVPGSEFNWNECKQYNAQSWLQHFNAPPYPHKLSLISCLPHPLMIWDPNNCALPPIPSLLWQHHWFIGSPTTTITPSHAIPVAFRLQWGPVHCHCHPDSNSQSPCIATCNIIRDMWTVQIKYIKKWPD